MNDPAATMQVLMPALAGVLVRFVWQGAAIGALAWLALALLRDARPQLRYAVACLALLSCLLVPAVELVRAFAAPAIGGAAPASQPQPQPAFAVPAGDAGGLAGVGGFGGFDLALPALAVPDTATPWIVAAWAAGVLVLSLRMALGLLWIRRLRRNGSDAANDAWQARVDRIAARMGIARGVALRLVPGAGTPLTAGWLRPVVLLPVAVASRLPVELVEALLAHELAHVRRHDYLVNLLQGVVEALLFYHPVVWWLSRRVRAERELVADDLAAAAIGNRRRLALALSELERCIPGDTVALPHLAPAAQGGQLMPRIQHLIRPQRRSAGALFALPLAGLVLAGAAFYAQAHYAVGAPAAAPATAPAAAPTKPERTPYAWVRHDKDGIAMSGELRHVDLVEAARAGIDGDFLWFERDGKAWVVRDPDMLARTRQAWAAAEPLQEEMQALQAQMQPHEARLRALSEQMKTFEGAKAVQSPEAQAALADIDALAARAQALAARQMQLSLRMRHADGAELAAYEARQAEFAREQAALHAQLAQRSASLRAISAQMEAEAAPRAALGRQMAAAGEPLNAVGKRMAEVGGQIERVARAADAEVRALIDEAWRSGRAEPAPTLD